MYRKLTTLLIAFAILIVLPGVAFATDADQEKQMRQEEAYKKDVQEHKQRAEMTRKEMEKDTFLDNNLITAERLNNRVLNEGKENEVEIVDFLVDTMSGKIEYAVVSESEFLGIGGDEYLVPYQSLQIDYANQSLSLDTNKVKLNEQSAYAPGKHHRMTMQEVERQEKRTGQKSTVAEDRKKEMEHRQAEMQKADEQRRKMDQDYYTEDEHGDLIELSALYNRELMDQNDNKIGTIDNVLIDADTGKIQMAVIESGELWGLTGDTYIVPWKSLKFRAAQEDRILLREKADRIEQTSSSDDWDWDGWTFSEDDAQSLYKEYDYEYQG